MKYYLTFLFMCCLSFFSGYAQTPGWQWARTNGGSHNDYLDAWVISCDPSGNVFVGMSKDGDTASFGSCLVLPNIGPPPGWGEAVIAKYDPSGNALWAKGFKGSTALVDIAADNAGNLFVLGTFFSDTMLAGTFKLTKSAGVHPDLFLTKLDAGGNVLWAYSDSGSFFWPGGMGCDTAGNVYFALTFWSASARVGSFILPNHDVSGLTRDIALAKCDGSGNMIWAKSIGGDSTENVYSMAIDPSGSLYISGDFLSATLAIGTTILSRPGTNFTSFIAKFDYNGNPLWAEAALTDQNAPKAIACNSIGDLYVFGNFYKDSFSFGSTIFSKSTPQNISSAYLLKLNSSGNILWHKTIDALGSGSKNGYYINAYDAATDPCTGDVWLTGGMPDSVLIDGSPLKCPARSDDPVFIAGFSSAGTLNVSQSLQSGGDDNDGITCDANGNLYITSDFYNVPILPFVIGHDTLPKSGQTEQFYLAKYAFPHTSTIDTFYTGSDTTICNNSSLILFAPPGYTSYTWGNGSTGNSISINTAGIYKVICFTTGTCIGKLLVDSIHVKLTDIAFSLGPDTTICSPFVLTAPIDSVSYLWQNGATSNSMPIDTSGLYYLTVTRNGCTYSDSVSFNFIGSSQHLKDTVVCKEQPVSVSLSAPALAGSSFLWSTGAQTTAIVVTDTGKYWVTVTNGNCRIADTCTVSSTYCDCWIRMPNAFTPNNDQNNDIFKAVFQAGCTIENYSFLVFNRWGQQVFKTNDPSKGWNGIFNGIEQPIGAYFYLVRATLGTKKETHTLKGDFILLR